VNSYVITLMDMVESVAVAKRCIASAQRFGITAEMWPGVWRNVAMAEMDREGLKLGKHDETWSKTSSVVGNFIAQYRVWKHIARYGLPALIMEHDAVVVADVPEPPAGMDIVSYGKPSFGKLRVAHTVGFQPLFSNGDKIPGAHGYYLTPAGADTLIRAAATVGVLPVDKFISPLRFKISEFWPWPIEAHDTFTTIQKPKGCLSKHNYGEGYRII
jgi:hypothetical protein